MKTLLLKIVGCWLLTLQQGYGLNLGKSQASSYFFMKQNGGYEYAFNTDTGMQSAQRADHTNEVTGHYMYYEKGVPFMVKYRAGVNGYQPEIIPLEQLMADSFNEKNKQLQNFVAPDSSVIARSSRATTTQTNNYRLNNAKVTPFNIDNDATLRFVQNALKTMQSQPMHVSFNSESESAQTQHPPSQYATTIRPTASTMLQPVSRHEAQEINNLALADTKPSYSLNYIADQPALRTSEASDPAGVVGSYSYFDETAFHDDVAYKINANSGFLLLDSNLAAPAHQTQRRQLFRSNNFNFNNYRSAPEPRLPANALDERNLGKRSLRKFRRYAKW